MSPFDLEDRTVNFSEKLIDLNKKLSITYINQNIVGQLLRSGTSIGANYCEANGAESKDDFKHKIAICKKEAKETMYWLRLLAKVNEDHIEVIRNLWKESQELTLIFSKILKSSKVKIKN